MKVLHFIGEGKGTMEGIDEYVIFLDDDEESVEDHKCPGFELEAETILLDGLPSMFPTETILIPKK